MPQFFCSILTLQTYVNFPPEPGGIFEPQATDSTPTKACKEIPECKKIQTHYSVSLAFVWSKSSDFHCVSRENN